jgi:hypothetical protein
MKNNGIYCLDCGYQFTEDAGTDNKKPCPVCTCTKKEIHESIHLNTKAFMSLRGQAKDNALPKKKKLRWDSLSGYEYSHKHNKLVKKVRVIDKDQNIYKEIIIDPDTDEILHQCEEPLDKHVGHGSAKSI